MISYDQLCPMTTGRHQLKTSTPGIEYRACNAFTSGINYRIDTIGSSTGSSIDSLPPPPDIECINTRYLLLGSTLGSPLWESGSQIDYSFSPTCRRYGLVLQSFSLLVLVPCLKKVTCLRVKALVHREKLLLGSKYYQLPIRNTRVCNLQYDCSKNYQLYFQYQHLRLRVPQSSAYYQQDFQGPLF